MKLCASWSIWSLGIQPEQLLLSRDSRRTNQQTRKHRNQLNFRLEHKQNFVQLKFLESCDKMIMINYSNPWLSTMGIKTVSIALFKNLIVQIIAVHNWKFSEYTFWNSLNIGSNLVHLLQCAKSNNGNNLDHIASNKLKM